ncbi:MAG: hypothetical protein PHV17_03010 [Candidatus Omnitrophica bacterium]|nr:hypothetical protein [Candidatus Omnitrophota bacterium]
MEFLIAMGISTLIFSASLTLMLSGRVSVFRNEELIHSQEQARAAMATITNELRLSSPFRVFIADNYSRSSPNNNGNTINFQIPMGSYNQSLNLTSSLSIKWGTNSQDGHLIAYFVDEAQLIRSEFFQADGSDAVRSVICPHIESITFSRQHSTAETINISITANGGNNSGEQFTLESEVRTRN